jgi:ribose 5-phosphate isomerase A
VIDQLAAAAVDRIKNGMIVGLGTGRAAARGIRALAERVRLEGLRLTCVGTSEASEQLGRSLGLTIVELNSVDRVDWLFDGADEVDPALNMLKGGGGAMTRERMVAAVALASGGHTVYMFDRSKLVPQLGFGKPLPIEVLPVAVELVRRSLASFGLVDAAVRVGASGLPVRTDNGQMILDVPLPMAMARPEVIASLAARLDGLGGVVDHGLFLTEARELVIEDGQGGLERRRRSDFET